MPTPIGHSLVGIAIGLVAGRSLTRKTWSSCLITVALANLPDVDFIPGYLAGNPREYHWTATHSLAAALTMGALVGAVVRRRGGRFGPAFAAAGAAYLSHILLDLLLGPGG